MIPPIFVAVPLGSVEGVLQTETVRYDKFVRRLLKGETPNQEARHWALGMLGEVAELFVSGQNKSYYLKELGDFYFYFQCGLNHYAIHELVPYVAIQDLGQEWESLLLMRAGQFTDLVKKTVVYDQAPDIEKLVQYANQIAGIFEGLCRFYETTLGTVLQLNAEKLATRYAGLVYSDLAAHLRRDENGNEDA